MPLNGLDLSSLNEAQRQAIVHVEGPLLILAGPGSGKTRVVTHRIAHLLQQGVRPGQIVALTFTNKAADEMRSRVERLAPGEPIWLGTFHRFCARLLRKYAPLVGLEENYTIYDTSDSKRALEHTIDTLDVQFSRATPDRIAGEISRAKSNLVLPEGYAAQARRNPVGVATAKVYPAYQARLRESNAVDFDDLLLHVATLLRENPEVRRSLDDRYRYLLIDEYQDTNRAQYEIARALSIDHPNLAVTGDPDQSIYGWRGANMGNLFDFERDYPEIRVIRLEQNYRSTKRILRVADSLIAHNMHRKVKRLHTENDEGEPARLVMYPSGRDEASAIAAEIAAAVHAAARDFRDFAIFYRVNALSRTLEFALRESGVPYQLVRGLEFYQRKEIKDILAYLHLVNNPRDDVAFLRIVNTPPRGIGKKTIERLSAHAARRGHTLLQAAREAGLIENMTKRAAVAMARFVAMFDHVSLAAHAPLEEIMRQMLSETGYQAFLEESDLDEDEERLANIEELLTAAREFDEQHNEESYLENFLEETSLVSDTDAWESDDNRVSLMTLHAAKGLEFPVVYIVATEEGLLPHERSKQDPQSIEEERRLFFVGITRAQQVLQISMAQRRDFRGRTWRGVPSHFLFELPRDEMEVIELGWTSISESRPTSVGNERAAAEFEAEPVVFASQLVGVAEPNDSDNETRSVDPRIFRVGMAVQHPEYGLGKIADLAGRDDKRQATINFATAGQKQIVLKYSPVRPLT